MTRREELWDDCPGTTPPATYMINRPQSVIFVPLYTTSGLGTGLRQVTCIVRVRHLRLDGHVARLISEEPVGFCLVVRRIWAWRAWRLPRRRLDAGLSEEYRHCGPGVCLGDGQAGSCLKDIGMTGLASAWATARRRPVWRIWAWLAWRLPGRWS